MPDDKQYDDGEPDEEGGLAKHTHHVHDDVPKTLTRRTRERHQPTDSVKPADLSDPRVRESLAAVIQELPDYTPPPKPKQADTAEPVGPEEDLGDLPPAS